MNLLNTMTFEEQNLIVMIGTYELQIVNLFEKRIMYFCFSYKPYYYSFLY